MKEHQAREVLFETRMKKFLEGSGYLTIVEERIYGRSGDHGIRSFAKINIPSAFSYPTRLLCQYKCYAKNKVDISHLRDFGGMIADVQENNFAMKKYSADVAGVNIADRYQYSGCYMSTTAFSQSAQEYAWAHDIFLMSFERIDIVQPMLKDIEEFVAAIDESSITNITRNELIEAYNCHCREMNISFDNINGMIGILNGVYPVLLLGSNNWKDSIINEAEESDIGRINIEQVNRSQNQYESKFEVMVKEANLEFSVPNIVFSKLMERKDNTTKNGVVFRVDVPYFTYKGKRGMAGFEIVIEGFSRDQYGYNQISFF
ncbi:MAG: restriction endonuclease [Lachnospiraceae bacterium]|nr:restriction endonuclease [Lachnospiraceae bacterium]